MANANEPKDASPSGADKDQVVLCPYCGYVQEGKPDRCGECGGLFEPLSRRATQVSMGPWFIRDKSRPFVPGCSYEVLKKLIRAGRVRPTTVLRGPTTRQFWSVARNVPGVAHLLGYCHACNTKVANDAKGCKACGTMFPKPGERNELGLMYATEREATAAQAALQREKEALLSGEASSESKPGSGGQSKPSGVDAGKDDEVQLVPLEDKPAGGGDLLSQVLGPGAGAGMGSGPDASGGMLGIGLGGPQGPGAGGSSGSSSAGSLGLDDSSDGSIPLAGDLDEPSGSQPPTPPGMTPPGVTPPQTPSGVLPSGGPPASPPRSSGLSPSKVLPPTGPLSGAGGQPTPGPGVVTGAGPNLGGAEFFSPTDGADMQSAPGAAADGGGGAKSNQRLSALTWLLIGFNVLVLLGVVIAFWWWTQSQGNQNDPAKPGDDKKNVQQAPAVSMVGHWVVRQGDVEAEHLYFSPSTIIEVMPGVDDAPGKSQTYAYTVLSADTESLRLRIAGANPEVWTIVVEQESRLARMSKESASGAPIGSESVLHYVDDQESPPASALLNPDGTPLASGKTKEPLFHDHDNDPGKTADATGNGKSGKAAGNPAGKTAGNSGGHSGGNPASVGKIAAFRRAMADVQAQEAGQEYEQALASLQGVSAPDARSELELKIAMDRLQTKIQRQPVNRFFATPAD